MMSQLGIFFVVLVVIAAVLSNIGIWAPRKTWIRFAAIAAAGLFIPTAYAAVSDLLSRPKPVAIEWVHRNAKEATVLGARIVEGRNIFLWLQLSGATEPRAYMLPYSEELAKQLHGAQRDARKAGTKTKMKRPFANDRDTEKPQFFAAPQKARPVKKRPGYTPHIVPQRQNQD
ncbi:MAG: hypothetical protein HOM58_04735 [Rhodospirillaceae bacterium]|jgi:hypothetical protein|nr:hypothetical protein [Rhodospirillaceae bacterium]MBT5456390.1 hypothetical protein [Rhodospirillaceae bacterium]